MYRESLQILREEGLAGCVGTLRANDDREIDRIRVFFESTYPGVITRFSHLHDEAALTTLLADPQLSPDGAIAYIIQATTLSDLTPYPPHNIFWDTCLEANHLGITDRLLPIMMIHEKAYTWCRSTQKENLDGPRYLLQGVLQQKGLPFYYSRDAMSYGFIRLWARLMHGDLSFTRSYPENWA